MSGEPRVVWFKPKRFGYGATPANWQGWLATLVFIGLMIVVVSVLHGGWRWTVQLLLMVCFVGLARATSSGPWRWRNGGSAP